MADTQLSLITPEVGMLCVEQRIKAGEDFTGEAPELATKAFAPFFDDTDGVIRMKEDGTPANVEADKGGLFTITMDRPCVLAQVLGNLGGSIAWTLKIVTALGATKAVQIAGATGQHVALDWSDRVTIFPGDKIEFKTTSGAAAMWLRVFIRTQP